MFMKILKKIKLNNFVFPSLAVFLFTPFVSFADDLTFESIVNRLLQLIGEIVPLLVGIAVVGVFYGVAKYILSAGNPEKRADGAKFMIYGIISLFVMVSIWGLVAILQATIFGNGDIGSFEGIPQLP